MIRALIVAALALAAPAAALAQQQADGAKKAADVRMCIGCHGIPGYHTAYPEVYHVPKIAGQQAGYIVSALKEYKSGARWHPSMRAIAASLSEEEMAALAAHYAEPAK